MKQPKEISWPNVMLRICLAVLIVFAFGLVVHTLHGDTKPPSMPSN